MNWLTALFTVVGEQKSMTSVIFRIVAYTLLLLLSCYLTHLWFDQSVPALIGCFTLLLAVVELAMFLKVPGGAWRTGFYRLCLLGMLAFGGVLLYQSSRVVGKSVPCQMTVAVANRVGALLKVDEKGTIIDVTGELERLTGYQRDELIGKPINFLFVNLYQHQVATPPDDKWNVKIDARTLKTKSGQYVPVNLYIAPRYNQLKF